MLNADLRGGHVQSTAWPSLDYVNGTLEQYDLLDNMLTALCQDACSNIDVIYEAKGPQKDRSQGWCAWQHHNGWHEDMLHNSPGCYLKDYIDGTVVKADRD